MSIPCALRRSILSRIMNQKQVCSSQVVVLRVSPVEMPISIKSRAKRRRHIRKFRKTAANCNMEGTLYRYGLEKTQLAFQSNDADKHLILIGGLTDGLLSLSYAKPLSEALSKSGWALVQSQLTSAYQGYGVSSLDQDAQELWDLAMHLKSKGCKKFAMMGYSTGCQDIVRFVQNHGTDPDIPQMVGAILQGPVSDQEDSKRYPETEPIKEKARSMMKDGQNEQIVARDFITSNGVPLTARRCLSLWGKGGDDDMFSSYFTDEDMQALLGHMSKVPSLVIGSAKDQYVPPPIDPVAMAHRISNAMGSKSKAVIIDGLHGLKGQEDEVVSAVMDFLANVD